MHRQTLQKGVSARSTVPPVVKQYETLASHALSDYSKCFRYYKTADVLIYDTNPATLEVSRSEISRIIIKDRDGKRVDEGRNTTVNVCDNYANLINRLITRGETYALVIISDPNFIIQRGEQGVVWVLRANGYENTLAFICNDCTLDVSRKCSRSGYDACLVRYTGTVLNEVNQMLARLTIRCIHTFQSRTINTTRQNVMDTINRNSSRGVHRKIENNRSITGYGDDHLSHSVV